MKQIQLVNHKIFCLCDDEDYVMLNQFSWYLIERKRGCYAYTKIDKNTVYMHQLVLPSDDSNLTPDHKNRNGLDNRRDNLRLATRGQQQANKGKPLGDLTSKYKGVRFTKGKWEANIRVNDTGIYLGRFVSERRAAYEYNKAAQKYFGEFASLNDIGGAN